MPGNDNSGQVERCPRSRFSTDALPAAERFAFWHDSLRFMVETTLDNSLAPEQFSAELDGFNLRDLLFNYGAYSAQHSRSVTRFKTDQGANPLSLWLFLEGSCQGNQGSRVVEAQAGDICLFDLSRPVEIHLSQCRALTLTVPHKLLAPTTRLDQLAVGNVIRGNTPAGKVLGHYLRSVWQKLPAASVSDGWRINQMLQGCVAGLFSHGPMDDAKARAALQHADLEYIRAYIDTHLANPSLGVEHLCRRFNYSRARLYQVFRPLGGVAAYIRQVRLARCLSELSALGGTTTRIQDVSQRWGFPHYSQFCRQFRRAYGVAPSEA
ncbi:MAG: helix-turn-helix domain-containing protein, partial [Sinobacteraceae bacterium]|nr:helix-turn-helix domain-containing protein [Nevskiaceae bacterium]